MSKHRYFTPEEDQYLRDHYPANSSRDVAERLGRTVRSVQHRAWKLGIRHHRCPRWTSEEDEVLRSAVSGRLDELAARLGRKPSAVSCRRKALGLGKWRGGRFPRIVRGYRAIGFRGTSFVMEHREVIERSLGRALRRGEVVHHINGVKLDNDIGNLHLCGSASEHRRVHDSFSSLMPLLVRSGLVAFDRDEGVYRLCEAIR